MLKAFSDAAPPPPPADDVAAPADVATLTDAAEPPPADATVRDTKNDVQLFVWTDSNGKFFKPKMFWKTEGAFYERTYMVEDVQKALYRNRNKKIGCILISCGVNDIEQTPGKDVANKIISLVQRIKVEHPSTKIVLSEITPFFARDYEVRECNAILHKALSIQDVYLVNLDRLRDAQWTKFRLDRKHIK